MELIERLGAYLGLASFFGLAVLALLYFSQARDVRRLRDWAGRAPERAAAAAEQASHVYAQQAEAMRTRRRRRSEGGRWPEPRYLALIVTGAIVFGAGLFVGAIRLLGDDEGGSIERAGGGGGGSKPAQRVVPATIRVAVLNGTDVPGLAAKVGDDVEANGFKLGAVTNTSRTYANTTSTYERGHRREAQAVAGALGVSRVVTMNPDVRSAAGGAKVAVIVGSDRT